MRIRVEIDEQSVRKLIVDHLSDELNVSIEPHEVSIQVKSKQNYRSEWEVAAFKAVFEADK